MGLNIIYFLIIVVANTVGAISGMGGGVIIKPMMDALGASPLAAINFYSSLAVFVMSIVSTSKQLKNGIKIKWLPIILLSMGSILGGILGDATFNTLLSVLKSEHLVNLIQIVLVIISLVLALICTKPSNHYWSKNLKLIMLIFSGLLLGWLATLLGIGGGPINVALLIFVFSMETKTATVYSIVIIFFSQISKLISTIPHISTIGITYSTIPFIILAAIVGGYVGAVFSKKMSSSAVMKLYKIIVIAVIVLNVVNGLKIIF